MEMKGKEVIVGGETEWFNTWKKHVRLIRAALTANVPDQEMQKLLRRCFADYSCFLKMRASSSARAAARSRPAPGTSLEAAFMWLDGWRASSAVVMISSLLHSEAGDESTSSLSEHQLASLDTLQTSIRKAELDLSQQLALLQMLVADQSMLNALTIRSKPSSSSTPGSVRAVMESKMATLEGLLGNADKLRLETLEELFRLLTTVQAARACLAGYEIVFIMRSMGGNATIMRSMSTSGVTLEEATALVAPLMNVQKVVVPTPTAVATKLSVQPVPTPVQVSIETV